MIEQVTQKLLNFLLKQNQLSDDPEEISVYKYGLEITISSLLNFVLIIAIGAISGNFLESMLFLLCFVPLRQYTGGFHANTYFKCNLYFCICFSVLLFIYNLTKNLCSLPCVIILDLISILLIAYFCPIDNANKRVVETDKKKYKVIAVVISCVISVVGILLLVVFNKNYGIIMPYTLLLVVVLVIISIINERRKICYE